MADEEIFVLDKYFNIEPINTTVGEIQLFPGALKIDLKNNGALINSRPSQSGKFARKLNGFNSLIFQQFVFAW